MLALGGRWETMGGAERVRLGRRLTGAAGILLRLVEGPLQGGFLEPKDPAPPPHLAHSWDSSPARIWTPRNRGVWEVRGARKENDAGTSETDR